MWSLAHLVFAFLVGLLINKRWKLDRLLFLTLLIATDLPDFDSTFFGLLGYDSSALHGGPTHTIIGILIIALIVAPLIWLIESIWINKNKSPGIQEDKKAWTAKRFQAIIIIAIIGGLIHLGVDILNTSNEYARWHHLYLWPLSDYSFHLDLMFAGMPADRMDAWQFRPLVRGIMIGANIFLIVILWALHFKSDTHLWDLLYSEKQYYLLEGESLSFLRKIQKLFDENKKNLNLVLLIACSLGFAYRIYEHFVYILTLL